MASITALLDTSVVVDISRQIPVAVTWLQSQRQTQAVFGLPVVVCMELIDGARNNAEKRHAMQVLRPFSIIHILPSDSEWAYRQHAQFRLSHSVGILDALIAAPAARLGVPIYTLNTKHFTPLPDVTAIKPY